MVESFKGNDESKEVALATKEAIVEMFVLTFEGALLATKEVIVKTLVPTFEEVWIPTTKEEHVVVAKEEVVVEAPTTHEPTIGTE